MVRNSLPVATSQILIAPPVAVTSRVPSGEKAAASELPLPASRRTMLRLVISQIWTPS